MKSCLEIFLYVTICTCVRFILMSSGLIHHRMDHSGSLPLLLCKLPLKQRNLPLPLAIYSHNCSTQASTSDVRILSSYSPPLTSVGFSAESEVAQSCLTLCHPVDCSPQPPPSMGFSRLECWSGLPFPPRDLPNSGIEPRSPPLHVSHQGSPVGQW